MRWRHVLVCFGLLAMLAGPAVALAQGGGSAGDQQYTDPFGGSSPKTHTTHTTTQAATTTTTQAPTTTSTPPATATATAPAVTDPGSTSTATAASSGKTLPYTGLDLWTVAGFGLMLTAGGLLIRSRSTRA